MIFGFDLVDYSLYHTVTVNHKSGSMDSIEGPSHELLRPPYPKGVDDRMVHVGQKRKIKSVFLSEIGLPALAIGTDSQKFIALSLQFPVVVPQVAGLGRTTRGAGPGEEKDHQFSAAVILEPDGISILVQCGKFGHPVPYLQSVHMPWVLYFVRNFMGQR